MKKYLLITLSLFAFVYVEAAKNEKTEIINNGPTQKVNLGKDVQEAITKVDPKFKLLSETKFMKEVTKLYKAGSNQTPMAISIDLDGDTFKDYVFLGESEDKYSVIAVIGVGTKWNAVKVSDFDKKEFPKNLKLKMYLTFMKQKELKYKKKDALSPRDALQIEFLYGSATAYYFDGKDFKVYEGKAI